jgi:hypothetical protein
MYADSSTKQEKLDKDWFHGNTSFARMTRTGVIKRGSLPHLLTREIEKGKKMTLDAKYEQNVSTDYKNIMERLAWYNIDEVSAQTLRAFPSMKSAHRFFELP